MISELIFGLFAPFIMVIFLTRVTYNHYISALLTLGIISAIHMNYYEPTYIIIFWGLSLTAGFFFSQHIVKNLKKK